MSSALFMVPLLHQDIGVSPTRTRPLNRGKLSPSLVARGRPRTTNANRDERENYLGGARRTPTSSNGWRRSPFGITAARAIGTDRKCADACQVNSPRSHTAPCSLHHTRFFRFLAKATITSNCAAVNA